MKKFLWLMLMISIPTVFITACSTSKEPSEAYRNETSHEIFMRGKEALHSGSYGEATKRFEALDVQYPFNPETEQAQLFIIYAYYMKEDYNLAVAAADHYIRMHPASPYVDYAYYMRGLSNYYQNLGVIERFFAIDLAKRDLTQIQKSYQDFAMVVRVYPQSRYAPAAHQFMIYLRNILAKHEYQVAQYYYSRKAFVAAANRASNVVAHFEGAPVVIDALQLMIKSYRQLGLMKQAEDTLRVLQFNYPNVSVNG